MPTIFAAASCSRRATGPVDDQLRYALPFPFPGKHGRFSKARHPRALLGSLLFVFSRALTSLSVSMRTTSIFVRAYTAVS